MIWNPWHGCHKISEGCRNCYVYRMDAKYEKDSSSVKRNKCFYDIIKRKRDGSYKIEKGEIEEKHKGYLSSLLRVAGLVHDLGNPPFGHFGEEAIKTFFKDYFVKNANIGLTENLTELEKADFTRV